MSERKHILVVEDDSAQRHLLARYLVRAGFEVTLVRDPVAALHFARRHRFDLVIVDYCIPYFTGGDFVRKLRECEGHAATAVVLWTVKAEELTEEGTVDDLTVPVVSKSSSLEHLLDVVSQCLAARSSA
jgi:CheY-like chemotaxis protein